MYVSFLTACDESCLLSSSLNIAGAAKRLEFATKSDHELQEDEEDDGEEPDLSRLRQRFSANLLLGSPGRENKPPTGQQVLNYDSSPESSDERSDDPPQHSRAKAKADNIPRQEDRRSADNTYDKQSGVGTSDSEGMKKATSGVWANLRAIFADIDAGG
eukprot:9478821-Pyramimonas_sp.AAC.2